MQYIFDGQELFNKLGQREVLLFGAGEDGENFLSLYKGRVSIKGFIDSALPKGEKSFIDEYPVYSYEDLLEIRRDEVIVVTSDFYAEEMVQQLENSGFISGQDFFVFVVYSKRGIKFTNDENLKKMECLIRHNEAVWKDYLPDAGENKLLITHMLLPSTLFIDWSYFANYLAKQYKAKIWTVDRKHNYSIQPIERMYRSFNADNKIFMDLTAEQKQAAQDYLDVIWPRLQTKEDWLQIKLDDVAIGEDIWAFYIRCHESDVITNVHTWEQKVFLFRVLQVAIFWRDLFYRDRSIKALLFVDGIYQDGIVRKFAIKNGIKVYAVSEEQRFLWNNYHPGERFQHYKRFFEELSEEEKTRGLAWAKEHLEARLRGDTRDIPYMDHSAFQEKRGYHHALEKNEKLKVVICPHVVWDNPYANGIFLFADHWEWLKFLGEMTLRTDYDWYLKVHPNAEEPDQILFHKLIALYPKIKLLPLDVTGNQLKEAGVSFVLTVWGTLGHEYPAMGIHVINAGKNPHMAFDFNWHPKTKEEYEYLLLHLDSLQKEIDMEQIYQFYCIHYLYGFVMEESDYSVCYKSPQLIAKLRTISGRIGLESYKAFLAEWTPERHEEILRNVAMCIEKLEAYRDDVFLRKSAL